MANTECSCSRPLLTVQYKDCDCIQKLAATDNTYRRQEINWIEKDRNDKKLNDEQYTINDNR